MEPSVSSMYESRPGPQPLRKGQCPQHPRPTAQARRHDVLVHVLEDLRRADVVVEERSNLAPHEGEEVPLVHDAAADDDALRREGADEVHEGQGEVSSLERPRRVIRGQCVARHSPAGEEGRPAREALEAITVERAGAWKRIGRAVVGKTQVTHLRVHQAVHELAAH